MNMNSAGRPTAPIAAPMADGAPPQPALTVSENRGLEMEEPLLIVVASTEVYTGQDRARFVAALSAVLS